MVSPFVKCEIYNMRYDISADQNQLEKHCKNLLDWKDFINTNMNYRKQECLEYLLYLVTKC